jgi:A/G-specific adenine glycosylase
MKFTRQLLSWYLENRRDLPWRGTRDPYLIWLSEIILQQTRVDQGLPYYEKFVAAYPTIGELAQADEQDILKLWQGLGYYSRARNMHAASRMILREHNGKFPDTYPDIRNLKGVGDYTAAAISSIAYDLPYPVVDGNVMRFFSRFFGITGSIDLAATKKSILDKANTLIDPGHPGDFNQAMMEFGATVCTPANPGCHSCILRSACFALRNGLVSVLPSRAEKTTIRKRYIHYLVITCSDGREDFIYMHKRTGNDIWKNLFDFPQLEESAATQIDCPIGEQGLRAFFQSNEPEIAGGAYRHKHPAGIFNDIDAHKSDQSLKYQGASARYDHQLTHQQLHARFYRFHAEQMLVLPFMLIPLKELSDYPLPRLVEKYLDDFFSRDIENRYLWHDDQL